MPTITFEVNLDAPLRVSQVPVTEPSTLADALANSRSTWRPDELRDNAQLRVNGAQFTVSGGRAVYLKNTYATGDYAVLKVVSEGMEFTVAGEVE